MSINWFLIPFAAAISLTWNASRYEMPSVILARSLKQFLQILFFMGLILLVLVALSYNL
jgi:hypothetical protein